MPNLANHSSAMGYLDYKVILYGNNHSRPLVLYITINSPGKVGKSSSIAICLKALIQFI